MMTRRTLVSTVAGCLLAAPLAAWPQQAAKPRVIGWLGIVSPTPGLEHVDRFRQGLEESGWILGGTLLIEYRWAHGRPERLPDLAADLIARKAEVIVAMCGPQIAAIRRASAVVPIVIPVCPNLYSDLVTSLARPGGQMTGLILQTGETSGKRLQLLKELIPRLSRLAVLMAAVPGYDPAFRPAEIKAAGRMLGIEVLDPVKARIPEDIESSFASVARRADALIVMADPLTLLHRGQIADAAMKRRLPVMFEVKEFVESGGLLSYGPNALEMFHRSAYYVDRILRGAKPADLPVEQPTKFELVINMNTAKALGLTVRPSLLLRADRVIE